MPKVFAIAFLAGAAVLAGCATDPNYGKSQTAAGKDEEVYTGSRLPRKSSQETSAKTMSGDTWRRESTQAIGNMPRGN